MILFAFNIITEIVSVFIGFSTDKRADGNNILSSDNLSGFSSLLDLSDPDHKLSLGEVAFDLGEDLGEDLFDNIALPIEPLKSSIGDCNGLSISIYFIIFSLQFVGLFVLLHNSCNFSSI